MRALSALLVVASALWLSACATVRASSVPSGGEILPYNHGPVAVRALTDPARARDLGAVEASGEDSLDALVEAFVEQVRGLGGNVARIDSVIPSVQTRMRPITQSVPCFGMRFGGGCSQTYLSPEEVPGVRLVGRALRVEAP